MNQTLRVSISLSVIVSALAVGCASKKPSTESSASGVAKLSKRTPADSGDAGNDADDEPTRKPPLAQSKATWIFNWTNRPAALANPAAYVAQAAGRGHDCLAKFQASPDNPVLGCEGDEMAAGPGLYTCDNPFTSHDYGSVMVQMRTREGTPKVANATGMFAAPPASDGLDRSIIANPDFDAIMYNFRANDFGGRALVLRSESVIDPAQTQALALQPPGYKRFKDHAAHACAKDVSLKEVFENWGDQFEFFSLVFNNVQGVALNADATLAAVASDAVAMPEDDLQKAILNLKAKYKEVKEQVTDSSCGETDSRSARSCLAHRIFFGLKNDQGTPNHPTNIFANATLVKVLVDLKILAPEQAKLAATPTALKAVVTKNFMANAMAVQRVREALSCYAGIRGRLEAGSFKNWGEEAY